MTQRDGMGRELGGGFRMGNTCTLMVDSSQCMAKPIHYCKVKEINKIKKKKKTQHHHKAERNRRSNSDSFSAEWLRFLQGTRNLWVL